MSTKNMGNITKHFGPQWFGSTMGTGALAISMALVSERLNSKAILRISQFFLFVAMGMFVIYIFPWTLRFFKHSRRVNRDINHPIRGQFFSTMPISLIVIGIGLATVGPSLFPVSSLREPCTALFFTGTTGIYIFGFILVSAIFRNKRVNLEHSVYTWYIPPVSHLIIPVLGLALVSNYYAGTFIGDVLFILSIASWGIGFFLFLFVGSSVYHRYAFAGLPASKLAPTFLIGAAPTEIMIIALAKLVTALKAGVSFGFDLVQLLPAIKLLMLIMWGFSAWWSIMAIILLPHYVRGEGHSFSFGWWGYTFPMAAFAISNGAIGHLIDFPLFWLNLHIVNFSLFFIWIVIFYLTMKFVKSGKAFVPE